MANQVEDIFLDAGLTAAKAAAAIVSVCAADPTVYSLATDGNANCLGFKSFGTNAAFTTGPTAGTSPTGRKLGTAAVTDGTIKTTGTASYWAVVGTASLYAHGVLSAGQSVTSGNSFSLGAFEVRIANGP